MKKLIISARTNEVRIALLQEGQLIDFFVDRPSKNEEIGQIYKGRIEKVIDGMQVAFVNIGLEKNGFLQRDQLQLVKNGEEKDIPISRLIREGEYKLFQIKKEGFGTKGPILTDSIELTGKYIIYLPEGIHISVSKKMLKEEERKKWLKFAENIKVENEGFIFRTATEGISEELVLQEVEYLRAKWNEVLQKRKNVKRPSFVYQNTNLYDRILRDFHFEEPDEIIIDDDKAFHEIKKKMKIINPEYNGIKKYSEIHDIFLAYLIEEQIKKLLLPRVSLENGATLYIEETEAMTVIDVNSTSFTGGRNKEDTIVKVNQEAAIEIVKQLRLRNIGGIIIIDFINMNSRISQKKVIETLQAALRTDQHLTRVIGFTELGLLEMTRKKERQPLSNIFLSVCNSCKGIGKVASNETIAFQVERMLLGYRGTEYEAIWIEVPYEVKTILESDRIQRLKESLYLDIFITPKEHIHSFNIRHLGSREEILKRIK